mmetsp:Transcript_18498/g.25452  ORF Transcript_18498/g.25452 Transcript_18498/m.25452 type:complete len:323 (-) Transcript_18498:21-989(-)
MTRRSLRPSLVVCFIILAHLATPCTTFSTPSQGAPAAFLSTATDVLYHLANPPPLQSTSLSDLANTLIPGPQGSDVDILAYVARPSSSGEEDHNKPVLILIHEFFGLNPSIVGKAEGLAEELDCIVVAPDTFRGVMTTFIPRAIWLALSTPQKRVNEDLDAVCKWVEQQDADDGAPKMRLMDRGLAIMGFCYGGGKAIRYTTQRRFDAATVVFYGSPLTDVGYLKNLRAPICGIYGSDDVQFPESMLRSFKDAVQEAISLSGGEDNSPLRGSDITVYDGVGHAFWREMEEVKKGDQPQLAAYEKCVGFLRSFFNEKKEAQQS